MMDEPEVAIQFLAILAGINTVWTLDHPDFVPMGVGPME